jgi:uncharacterized phiE125 gp8 family phage protein
MWDRIERLTAPAIELVTLAEVKQHCRVDTSDDDGFLERAIKSSREVIEGPTGAGIVMLASQWQMRLDCFATEIWIPTGPVISIDAVAYVDAAGALQTLGADQYQWRKGHYEARIRPAYGRAWPTLRHVFDAVRVTFTAGFAGTDEDPPNFELVPSPLKTAMLMLIGHWYEIRETVVIGQIPAEIQFGFAELVNRHRVGRFA